MSGPKCASYSVVSVEELLRRRLATAQAKMTRLRADADLLSAEAVGIRAAYDETFAVDLQILDPRTNDVELWEEAANALDAKLTSARASMAELVAKARYEQLRNLVFEFSIVDLSPPASPPAAISKTVREEASIGELLKRIPATATDKEVEAIEDIVNRSKSHDTAQVALALRYEIQRLRDRGKARVTGRKAIDELLGRLDGLEGSEVSEMRGFLRGLDLSESLDSELFLRVDTIKQRAEESMNQAFVEDQAAQVLGQLGYSVGPDFVTAVPKDGALVDLPKDSRHAVRVRVRRGQLLFNVVRFDERGRRNPDEDAEAERRFCDDFSKFKMEMSGRGVNLDLLREDPPGSLPVELVTTKRRKAKTTEAGAEAQVLRERSRHEGEG